MVAAQHLYGPLPREHSPHQQAGYQTIAFTPGLAEADLHAIEDRAQYSQASNAPVKWQCSQLPSGQFALSRICPVDARDEFGRQGSFLAHSLVIAPADRQALDCGPFDLIEAEASIFVRSLEAALALPGAAQGRLETVTLPARSRWLAQGLKLARNLDTSVRSRLYGLQPEVNAIAAPIAMIGPTDATLAFLIVLYTLSSPAQRALLSFDTGAAGCDWRQGQGFWALGYDAAPPASAGQPINLGPWPNIQTNAPASSRLYHAWIDALVTDIVTHPGTQPIGHDPAILCLNGDSEVRHRNARMLEALLVGQPTDRLTLRLVDPLVLQSFAAANEAAIAARVRSLLDAMPLPAAIAQAIATTVGLTPAQQLSWLAKAEGTNPLPATIQRLFLQSYPAPPPALDPNPLQGLIAYEPLIGALLGIWCGDEELRLSSSEQVAPEQYNTALKQVYQRVGFQPLHFFAPSHLRPWLDYCRPLLRPGDLQTGIVAAYTHGQPQRVDALAEQIVLLTPGEQEALLLWIEEQHSRTPALRRALEQALGRKVSLWDRLRSGLRG